MRIVPRLALVLGTGLALAGAVGAAPITLTDGVSRIVVDPESQDGWKDWITNGSVDHLGKHWFWWRLGKDGAEQSIDTLNLDSVAVSDADADGDDDTLILRYRHPDDVFTLEIRWNLMTAPQLQPSGFGLVYAQVKEHLLITMPEDDERDLYLFRYVNPEMGGSPGGDQVFIGCLEFSTGPECDVTGVGGEHDDAGTDGSFSHVFSDAPRHECDWDDPDDDDCEWNRDVAEAGLHPGLLDRLTDGNPTDLDTEDNVLRGVDIEACDECNIDFALLWRVEIHANRQIMQGAVHTLRADSVLPTLPGGLPGIEPLFEGLVVNGDLFGSMPNGLRRFGFGIRLMAFFSERQWDRAACRIWTWAVDRSDGDQNDLVTGNGLPVLQDALMQAGKDDGCYPPDPIEPQ
jgi:hypothetical protein